MWSAGVRSVVTAGLVLGSALVAVAPAAAHTQLVGTTPQRGSVVAAAQVVSLRFDGAVLELGAAMRVSGPGGEVSAGRPAVQGDRITQALRPDLPDGTYQVLWRATAGDGHVSSGEWQFSLAGSASAGGSQPASAPVGTGRHLRLDALASGAVAAVLAICAVVLVRRRRRRT